jgi:methylglutaconyl-CoA hydratase
VRIGFVAAMVLVFLSRQLGERRAKDLLLTGRTLNAEEAQEMGIVTRIVPGEVLMDEAMGVAREFRGSSPASMALTKELLWRTAGLSMDSALDLAELVNTYARTGPDVREGLSAFLEKRRTSWSQK